MALNASDAANIRHGIRFNCIKFFQVERGRTEKYFKYFKGLSKTYKVEPGNHTPARLSPLDYIFALVKGLVNEAAAPDRLGLAPLFTEDGPQHLVQKLAIFEERAPEHALLDGAKLA